LNVRKLWEGVGYRRVTKSRYFAIQLNETTGITNWDIRLCFVRYMGKYDFKEKSLCFINFPGRTTGSEIFRLIKRYFS